MPERPKGIDYSKQCDLCQKQAVSAVAISKPYRMKEMKESLYLCIKHYDDFLDFIKAMKGIAKENQ